jgi:L,D-peptidoglycan transpeptidase YkuD (ErfK/YbiS/YcfS/YnhG family)
MSFCWIRLAAALSFVSFAVAAAADPESAQTVDPPAVIDAAAAAAADAAVSSGAPAGGASAVSSVDAAAGANPSGAAAPASPVSSQSDATATDAGANAAAATSAAAATVVSMAAPVAVAPAAGGAGPSTSYSLADRIVVRKSQRRLYLMQADRVIAEYPIRLGLNPVGPKEREGDFRTPEGTYLLTRRNQASDFFLSIQVSYPNAEDLQRAQRNRWEVGGQIMVHGWPNNLRHPPDYYASTDWTDGCIALSNSDMVEFWLLSPDNMTIEITP